MDYDIHDNSSLGMIDEFDLPKDIVDRQVKKMTMISPTNKEVQIGQTLKDSAYQKSVF